jgi:hypothetical protein
MKFNGLHLHMILVVVMICIVVYVYYVSKDIITIDREMKNVKAQVNTIQQYLTTNQLPSQESPVQRPPPPPVAQLPQSPDADADADDDVDDASVDTDKIKHLINSIQDESDTQSELADDVVSDAEEDAHDVDVEHDDATQIVHDMVEKIIKDVEDGAISNDVASNEMPIAKLRGMCKQQGISGKGSKDELVARLRKTMDMDI